MIHIRFSLKNLIKTPIEIISGKHNICNMELLAQFSSSHRQVKPSNQTSSLLSSLRQDQTTGVGSDRCSGVSLSPTSSSDTPFAPPLFHRRSTTVAAPPGGGDGHDDDDGGARSLTVAGPVGVSTKRRGGRYSWSEGSGQIHVQIQFGSIFSIGSGFGSV
ncbi:hypothetical protein HanXRQr2_Chr01g0005891 [Helianthus annuus]|uniref:Uncharacterized protein n=1 Tax=Helianthus annuus TaxID=4232 RepID=A0A251VKJ1_HELAN|nr:hypothetical protein HanXRQr2_Chr01g0005891 [Helianthus annuus]KAJ0621251.1 hypothetical protein HanIR_Chr01g0006541 [Helianthus annuus]